MEKKRYQIKEITEDKSGRVASLSEDTDKSWRTVLFAVPPETIINIGDDVNITIEWPE